MGQEPASQYKRAVALARRLPVAEARNQLEYAIGDLPLLDKYEMVADEADVVRKWLERERDALEISTSD